MNLINVQKKNRLLLGICLFMIIILSASGCKQSTIFREHYKIPDYIWDKDNVCEFNFIIKDTAASYNVTIDVRHATYYPGDKLMVLLTMINPAGEKAAIPISLPLKDSEGKFTGKGSGDIWDNPVEVFNSMKFPSAGSYTFRIENNQPEPRTVAIMELGLIVKKQND